MYYVNGDREAPGQHVGPHGRRGGTGRKGARVQPARRLCVGASGWGPSAHQRHVNVAKTHVHGTPGLGGSEFEILHAVCRPETTDKSARRSPQEPSRHKLDRFQASGVGPCAHACTSGGRRVHALCRGDANHASQCSSTASSNHGARPTSYVHGSVNPQSVPCNRRECAGGCHAPCSSCG